MKALVCSVKSYSEVNSRDYLVVAINTFAFYLESGFKTPQKEQKLEGKVPGKYFKLELDL